MYAIFQSLPLNKIKKESLNVVQRKSILPKQKELVIFVLFKDFEIKSFVFFSFHIPFTLQLIYLSSHNINSQLLLILLEFDRTLSAVQELSEPEKSQKASLQPRI